ncbi:MAG: methylmalonyl-CoA epimerase [Bacteroidales bacterium]|nr:methylmalonyl-CoA epimerase [Bacteroidales bacterium]
MGVSGVEHIGIAVRELDQAIRLYEKILGVKCYKQEIVPEQKVRTAFFMAGNTKIELLESTDPEGPIGKFIEKRGEGIHHIAFLVKDIDEQLTYYEGEGIGLIDKKPRKGAEGLDIAFLHPKSTNGALIEVCDEKKE